MVLDEFVIFCDPNPKSNPNPAPKSNPNPNPYPIPDPNPNPNPDPNQVAIYDADHHADPDSLARMMDLLQAT